MVAPHSVFLFARVASVAFGQNTSPVKAGDRAPEIDWTKIMHSPVSAKRIMEGTKWIIRGMVLAGVIAAAAAAQTAVPPPAFEVASVKRYTPPVRPGILAVTRSDPGPSHFEVSGTRISAIGNLLALVRLSYDLEASHVRLSPEMADNWATSEVYEIDARAPGDAIPTLVQVREMTQTLLAERFQLKVSRRSQVMPVYNLVVAPGGPKLQPSAFADSAPLTQDGGSAGLPFACAASISPWPISWSW